MDYEEFANYWKDLPHAMKIIKVSNAAVVYRDFMVQLGIKLCHSIPLKECSHVMYMDIDLKTRVERIVKIVDGVLIVQDAVGEKTKIVFDQVLFGYSKDSKYARLVTE